MSSLYFLFKCQSKDSDLMSVLTSFRKNMLNDLLRFDVKDCSWCRWVYISHIDVDVLMFAIALNNH